MDSRLLLVFSSLVVACFGQGLITFEDVIRGVADVQKLNAKNTWENMAGNEIVEQMTKIVQLQPRIFSSFQDLQNIQSGLEILKSTSDTVSPSQCLPDVIKTTMALMLTNDTWPKLLIDAWGKPPAGIFLPSSLKLVPQTFLWLGSYSECQKIIVPSQHGFNTKYCTATVPLTNSTAPVNPFFPIAFKYGICMPSSCTGSDIQGLLNKGIQILLNVSLVKQVTCKEEDHKLTPNAILVLVILCIFAAVMCLATAYDVIWCQKRQEQLLPLNENSPNGDIKATEHTPLINDHASHAVVNDSSPGLPSRLLLSFSVYTNGSKLLSTNQGAGALSCINGIRFLSISWVLLGHCLVFAATSADNIFGFLADISKTWTYQAILNATVSVDSFFTISGLLLTYLFLKESQKNAGKVNWIMFYFHRFWRLTPPYMLIMVSYTTLFSYWSNGPLWPDNGTNDGLISKDNCGDYWWRNILYINNFFPQKEMCMGWSWYLANDMQFYVISPIILIPMVKFPVIGTLVAIAVCSGSIIATAVISSYNELSAGFLTPVYNGHPNPDGFDLIYIRPWTRIGPYIIGMLTGYVLYRSKCSPPFRSQTTNLLFSLCGWCVAAVCCLSVLYGLYDDTQNGGTSYQVAALYNAVNRTVWAVGLCWVIYACCIGYGGFVNTLLSWKAFIPLSRLTYCVYLIHPVLLYYYYYSRETLMHFTNFTLVIYFTAMMVLSFGASFFVSLAFESPMLGIEKAIFGKRKKA